MRPTQVCRAEALFALTVACTTSRRATQVKCIPRRQFRCARPPVAPTPYEMSGARDGGGASPTLSKIARFGDASTAATDRDGKEGSRISRTTPFTLRDGGKGAESVVRLSLT